MMKLKEFSIYQEIENYLPVVGRILLGVLFTFQGITKVTGGFQGFASYIESLGIPAATIFAALVVIIEILGGLAIIAGIRTRLVGLVLGIYMVIVNLVAHQFWIDAGELQSFIKNLGLIGGLTLLGYSGSGKFSIDSFLE